jgi:nucleotide-binding universal stress UspA family protein
MYKRILMPSDGSACSTQAVEHGLNLARSIGAEVTFLYAVEVPATVYTAPEAVPYYAPELYEDLKKYAEEVLSQAEARAREAGVTAGVRLCERTRPVEAILKAMPESDLMVMGSHGRSGARRLLLGSVTEGVSRQSEKPVLVVRCPERSQDDKL